MKRFKHHIYTRLFLYTATALYFGLFTAGVAQQTPDTLRLRLPEAEEQFLRQNLALLAAKYDIDIADAAARQAALWDNPRLGIEQNIYNQFTGKYFDVTATGQTTLQLEQLILLGGKRGKRVALEQSNRQQAEYAFYDLMRSLKYELRTAFYDLYFFRQTLALLEQHATAIQRITDAYDGQLVRGNISRIELLRLKSLLFSIENDQLGVQASIRDRETTLRLLLQLPDHTDILPEADTTGIQGQDTAAFTPASLREVAFNNRSDLRKYQEQVRYAELDLAYQEALAVPDLTLGAAFDRAGSYIQNYTALTLQIDLPFFNRNQGGIAAAEVRKRQGELLLEQYKLQVSNEVTAALAKLRDTDKLYQKFDRQFTDDYTAIIDNLVSSYQKQIVGILEFTDMYESYRDSMVRMYQLRSERMRALETINLAVGKTLFNN